MKAKVQQHYDPVYFDPFEEWDDKDIQNAILMGNFYYQPSFLFWHPFARARGHLVM